MIRDIGIPGINSENLLEAMSTVSYGIANLRGEESRLENGFPVNSGLEVRLLSIPPKLERRLK
jgi:hypothetical protein